MSRCTVYLDESGDLGFKFTHPYRNGGSSRHLTLGAVICPEDSDKYLSRFVSDFYSARNIKAGAEKKWSDMKAASRLDFAKKSAAMQKQRVDIRYATITSYKPRVQAHIQADPNKLYNYMARSLLLPIMRGFDEVLFIPDARSIKVESGSSLHDYLQTELWFTENVKTILTTTAKDSSKTKELHFTDWVCGVSQSYFEDAQKDPFDALKANMLCRKLFFPA